MTSDEALQQFGLPTLPAHLPEIRRHLAAETAKERESQGLGDTETIRTLCAQLFSAGLVEDALRVWKAKSCSFDLMCGLDVQLLCGAGLQATQDFLRASTAPEASAALDYLNHCEQSGDFISFTPAGYLNDVRSYYGLTDSIAEQPPP
ncbi:MAG: hypothetical protein ACO1TE_17370 [Prosthecobacter sp.]